MIIASRLHLPLRAPLLLALLLSCGRPGAGVFHLAEHSLDVPVRLDVSLAAEEKLSPALRRSPGLGGRVLVDLGVQVDLHRLGEEMARRAIGRAERRNLAVAALEGVAAETQARLRPALEELQARGLVTAHRGYSVVNRLLVEASAEGIRELARLPEVAAIVEETESELPVWAGAAAPAAARPRRSWAIGAIGADRVWQRGLDGSGVVVGILDSGASAVHEQLRPGFRGGPDAWHDPRSGSPAPRDGARGHGTGVLSVAVGRNVAGLTLGVAPGAGWIACAALPDGHYNNVLLTECADWMLTVGQPDVLINAWLLPDAGCDRWLQPLVDAWRAAEILPVFAAGNHGPEAGSDHSPANFTGLYPGTGTALSVGGLTRSGNPYARSAAGPNSCDGSTFPVLAAPAEDLVTALPLAPGTYLQAQGTSYAAGLAAGAAALLLQGHPEASVAELEMALREGAVDVGPEGPDPRFGHGRLDVPGALEALDRIRGIAAADVESGEGRSPELRGSRAPS